MSPSPYSAARRGSTAARAATFRQPLSGFLRTAGRVARLEASQSCIRPTHGGSASVAKEARVLTRQLAESATRTQAPDAVTAAPEPEAQSERLLNLVTSSLDQDGAEDILGIPLAGKSTVADHMVIASGRSTRHVAALSEKLVERLKADAGTRCRVEGRETADWVLIDAGDVIVHVFRPEVREFYQLEKMWLATPDRTARPA